MRTGLLIFLADDHAIVRDGLRLLIDAQRDMRVVGEASDGWSAIERAAELAPDIAVLDISMPGLNGAEAAAAMRFRCPDVRVVALTVHEDQSYVRQVLQAGAVGYVLKRAAASELIGALRTVAAGGTYVDPGLAEKLLDNHDHVRTTAACGTVLSDREEEVLRLIAQGYSNKEVAVRLAISVKTVETYKARSLDKLSLRSRVDLVRFALQQGWFQEP